MPKINFRRANLLAGLALAGFIITASSAILSPMFAQAAPTNLSQSLNLTATVLPNSPTTQAVITQPVNDQRFTTTPLVVQGTCQPNLLVRVFNNNELAGSITCSPQGDFVMNITLILGKNVLTSLNFDSFEQVGPVAPAVTVHVDEAIGEQENQPITTIAADGTITTETPEGQPSADPSQDYQRMFEGTIIEPLAKALDVSAVVSPSTNTVINVAMNSMFIMAVLGLLAILLL